jgi:dTDP-glucose 4,6-dehydratase
MSKIILVTGGAGFIGSNFILHFLKNHKDFSIVNFDSLTYAGNLSNLSTIEDNSNYAFVKGDITNSKDVKNVFEEYKPDYVVHFAAESHVDRSILDSEVFIKTNVLGTNNLLTYARENKIEKFVHISTDEVYGSLGSEGYFTENSNIAPNSPYAASKASSDLLVRAAFKTYGQNVNITRCSNNYGPYQFPEKLIPLMINNAVNDIKLPIYGDGKNVRDWIFVEDHCRAIEAVLLNGTPGEVYNIGSNNEWANIDLVKLILKKLGKSEELITFVKDRPGHDKRYAIDSSKIREELSWKPQTDFAEGINITVDWYLNFKKWTENIINGEYMEYYRKQYSER